MVTEKPFYDVTSKETIIPPPDCPDLRRTRESYQGILSDIKEVTEKYAIRSSSDPVATYGLDHEDLSYEDVKNESLMLRSHFCDESLIADLWAQKSRMDPIFDDDKGRVYYEVRDRLFPQDRKGSSRFLNRAGDKLWQVLNETKLVGDVPEDSVFFDICGGPGAFSQLLLEKFNFDFGYGMTLNVPILKNGVVWYDNLLKSSRFKALFGADGSGNVYLPSNLEHVTEELLSKQVHYVVSDGGLKIDSSDGNHMENLQEIVSARIILSEVVLMVKTISVDGSFVIKLFDTFSSFTASIIYIVSKLFEETYIVKPIRSRIVNSEKYLVGKRLKQKGDEYYQFKTILERVHTDLYDKEKSDNKYIPKTLVPISVMLNDKRFISSMKEMNEDLCHKQTKALRIVMNEVEKEI